MGLHPDAVAFYRSLAESGRPHIWEVSPQETRQGSAAIAELIGAGPDVEDVAELEIEVGDGTRIAARRYRPSGALGTLVWLHGGGWVIDGIAVSDAMCRILADTARATVISVDYRVAPEHPFPVPVDDCWDALLWAAEREQGPLVIGGDSAGGNMAAVCALRARDRGGPTLAAQVLVYPVVDTDTSTTSYLTHGADETLMLGRREMEWFIGHYLPDLADRAHPDAAPLRAGDLSRLPPAIVVIAEYDPLRDEGVSYAEALSAAGVEVSVHRYDDQPHGFFSFVNAFQTGNRAVERVGAQLREIIAAQPAPDAVS
ncbi:MAG TPA: alpha/beta hydrolase [Solirubrobacteraceae bacterium]|jgi:acetyl esterase|nr:alpha/beta hydrolase [Solirubrobacteraceae bacterium]